MELNTATLTAIAGTVTTICSAIGGWMLANKKSKKIDTETTLTSFKELSEANKQFRDEIRGDLQKAQERIAVLEAAVTAKDNLIMQLQAELVLLKAELERVRK